MPKTNNPHRGSDFRDFLARDGILAEVEGRSLKRAIALQLQKAIKESALTKSEMASRMHTSRAVVDRLLDSDNPSLTLATLGKAAQALGRKLRVDLLPA
jgi:predicted XRE-type DNA-binding protein